MNLSYLPSNVTELICRVSEKTRSSAQAVRRLTVDQLCCRVRSALYAAASHRDWFVVTLGWLLRTPS